jgi:GTP-binding protein
MDAVLDAIIDVVPSFSAKGGSAFGGSSGDTGPDLKHALSKVEGVGTTDVENTNEDVVRVAVIGRPNAGKSTLVNKIFGTERVIAHDIPGTTRDTIDVEVEANGKKYIFVDTAGLKKKGKTIETLDKYSAIKTLDAISRADVTLLVVDSNGGFTHQDRALFEHAYSEGKGVIVLFNKWDDLITDSKVLEKFYTEKLEQFNNPPFLFISAKTGSGIDKIFHEVDKLHKGLHYKFTTSVLNDLLQEFKEEHNIPSHNGKPVKLNYITQIKTTPPTFVIFTNLPEGVKESYKKFLANKLQKNIGNGVPIRIKFRKK